ncbi:MAG: hypothetical protein LC640_09105 [Frankia sp.]|nr:hypothetical protein [Frankia sp.]
MRRLLALLVLAGCARIAPYVRTPQPCQDQAVGIVWHDVYRRTDPPPDIWWVPAADLNCQEPGHEKGYGGARLCMGGNSWKDGVNLVWYGNWTRTRLAHEDWHVVLLRNGMDPDAQHQTAAFQPGGIVEQANRALAAMGCR